MASEAECECVVAIQTSENQKLIQAKSGQLISLYKCSCFIEGQ